MDCAKPQRLVAPEKDCETICCIDAQSNRRVRCVVSISRWGEMMFRCINAQISINLTDASYFVNSKMLTEIAEVLVLGTRWIACCT